MGPTSLTVAYVPGGTPAKWAGIWAERHREIPLILCSVAVADAAQKVRDGRVDVALLRLPADTSGLAVIPLYEEVTVAVVAVGHLLTAAEEITAADLEGEPVLLPLDDVVGWAARPGIRIEHRPETTEAAIELVAAGLGTLVVPQSLARLYRRRDVTYRPIADAPKCAVALAFPDGPQSPLLEDFIGVVRGRKPGSSRGRSEPPPKRTAREKAFAKQAARAAAGNTARRTGRP